MGRKAKTVKSSKSPVRFIEDEDDEQTDSEKETVDLDAVEDSQKLADFLSNFGGKEYKVRVDQFNATDKVWEYLDTFPLDGFDPYETCKRFGRGRYRMTFLNEKGKYVPGGQPQIRIGGVVAPATSEVPKASDDPLKHPLVVMMLAQMEKSQAQSTELLKAVLARPEAPKSSTSEVLDLLAKIKSLEPKDRDSDQMKSLTHAILLKMVERGMEGGEGGGEKSAWQEIVEGLKDAKDMGIIDKLLSPMNKKPAPQRPQPPAPVRTEVRVALPHAAPEASVPAPMENPLYVALKPYVAILVSKAENSVTPEAAGDYIVDEFYETVVPLIKKHVAMAKFMSDEGIAEYAVGAAQDAEQIEKLYAFAPELVPHREWVSAAIAQAVKTVTEPEPEATAEAHA